MERIYIDFNGHLEMAKEDMKIQRIDEATGAMVPVDVTNLSAEEIVNGLKSGKYYLSFVECYQNAVDGSDSFEYELDEDF